MRAWRCITDHLKHCVFLGNMEHQSCFKSPLTRDGLFFCFHCKTGTANGIAAVAVVLSCIALQMRSAMMGSLQAATEQLPKNDTASSKALVTRTMRHVFNQHLQVPQVLAYCKLGKVSGLPPCPLTCMPMAY